MPKYIEIFIYSEVILISILSSKNLRFSDCCFVTSTSFFSVSSANFFTFISNFSTSDFSDG